MKQSREYYKINYLQTLSSGRRPQHKLRTSSQLLKNLWQTILFANNFATLQKLLVFYNNHLTTQ